VSNIWTSERYSWLPFFLGITSLFAPFVAPGFTIVGIVLSGVCCLTVIYGFVKFGWRGWWICLAAAPGLVWVGVVVLIGSLSMLGIRLVPL